MPIVQNINEENILFINDEIFNINVKFKYA